MSNTATSTPKIDRYVVIHVATTCDEHGVYVTKDSAEVIEIGWMLLDAKSLQEVSKRETCCTHSAAQHYTAQLCTALHCTASHCITLHHTALQALQALHAHARFA